MAFLLKMLATERSERCYAPPLSPEFKIILKRCQSIAWRSFTVSTKSGRLWYGQHCFSALQSHITSGTPRHRRNHCPLGLRPPPPRQGQAVTHRFAQTRRGRHETCGSSEFNLLILSASSGGRRPYGGREGPVGHVAMHGPSAAGSSWAGKRALPDAAWPFCRSVPLRLLLAAAHSSVGSA